MNNLVVTVPKSRFNDWATAERVLRRCDGETDYGEEGSEWLWFIRTSHLPKKPVSDSVCFMIYDGAIRGYFHIIETSDQKSGLTLAIYWKTSLRPGLSYWPTGQAYQVLNK